VKVPGSALAGREPMLIVFPQPGIGQPTCAPMMDDSRVMVGQSSRSQVSVLLWGSGMVVLPVGGDY
jgi:hypothetical protein